MTSNGTMANGSKKRKASELDADHNNTTPKPKARGKSKGAKGSAKYAEDIPFRPECPYKPSNRPNDDVFVQREAIVPDFEFDFGIRPGLKWKNMRSYRNVKLQDHTFSVGTVIYINKQVPPPKSPHPDASDAEILKYDRTNFWVGRIADTRAESDKAVFLRVYWLYWPEELPMGRQPYHGDRELVLSNAMDIVDAQTISGPVDLTHWDERDSTHLYQDRFWRQTFDVSQLGKDKKGGLSELRKHCKCHQPHNPDKNMFQCKRSACMMWNHEECLNEDVLERSWRVYEKDGTLDGLVTQQTKGDDNEGEGSLKARLLTPMRQFGKIIQNKITPSVNTVIEQAIIHPTGDHANGASVSSKKGRPPKKAVSSNVPIPKPWAAKLSVRVFNTDEKDDDSPTLAEVTEISSNESDSQARSWQIHVDCLVCGHPIFTISVGVLEIRTKHHKPYTEVLANCMMAD